MKEREKGRRGGREGAGRDIKGGRERRRKREEERKRDIREKEGGEERGRVDGEK